MGSSQVNMTACQPQVNYPRHIDNYCDLLLSQWGLSEVSKALHASGWNNPDEWDKIMDENVLHFEIGLTRKQAQLFMSKYKSIKTPHKASKQTSLTQSLSSPLNNNNNTQIQVPSQTNNLKRYYASMSQNISQFQQNQNQNQNQSEKKEDIKDVNKEQKEKDLSHHLHSTNDTITIAVETTSKTW
eukprot:CAMPEP_0201596554 /NCGR_PEP_ID=MMETSP0190_2-20130828/193215_1 /ASSEMBLY_ACC=CAM_ASM_000263 /TAXON_ID=37353 /ORGANISM="Rosalina sp." /LENGTH=184 /DNA_ID=CAMNT_0048056969 /DNA_START=21 /DNA_END=572 /DNA_ORIENTATION=+